MEKQKSSEQDNNSSGDTSPTSQQETLRNEAGTSIAQQNGGEDTPNSLNNPDMVVRQRTAADSHEHGPSSNDSHTSERTRTSAQTVGYSMADYISLVLLWIVAAVLVILILRRLASESNSLSKV